MWVSATKRFQTSSIVPRLDDREWEAIVGSLPPQLAVRARNRERDYRSFLEGVLWVVGEDAFWAELPDCYGPWRALYVRFLRWNQAGVWSAVAEVIGRDTTLARALMRRSDQHAIVRRRRTRNQLSTGEGPVDTDQRGC